MFDDQLLSGTLESGQMLALFVFGVLARWLARRLVRRVVGAERCIFVGSDESFDRLAEKLWR